MSEYTLQPQFMKTDRVYRVWFTNGGDFFCNFFEQSGTWVLLQREKENAAQCWGKCWYNLNGIDAIMLQEQDDE